MKLTVEPEDFLHYENNLDEAVGLCIDEEGELIEKIGNMVLKVDGIFAEFYSFSENSEDIQIVVDYCLTQK